MMKRRMKQRVAVALATVWLASIVGASVPSGETTAFSTHRPPGPSSDQYTPLLRNPRYYPQDDYRQDWMNDEPARIKVANRPKSSVQGQPAKTDSDRSLLLDSPSNEFFNRGIIKGEDDSARPEEFQSNHMKTPSESDKEAMRLSSMKVAFDEPIDSELSDNGSEEDWISHDLEEDDEMQQDQFVADDTFEDEGPGSVEVYKLDLYKDRSILIPKPLMKNYLRNKSKIPKKVGAADSTSWKAKDPEESKHHAPKVISMFDHSSDQLSPPSSSLKDRIFGVGGVPELQVGCEGVEGSQRQKRSDSKDPVKRNFDKTDGVDASTSVYGSQLWIEPDYDSEEYFDDGEGTDELLKILKKTSKTTDSPLNTGNRGDMDPRVKTPADIEADKVSKGDKLPIRGDLGTVGDPNLMGSTQTGNSSNENPAQIDRRRKQRAVEENLEGNAPSKKRNEYGEGVMSKREGRGHRRAGQKKGGKRRGRKEKELKKKDKVIDKMGQDRVKKPEEHIGQNRLASVVRNQRSNLSHQLPARQDKRSHSRINLEGQQLENVKRRERRLKNRAGNKRKLQTRKRNTTHRIVKPIESEELGTNRAEYDQEIRKVQKNLKAERKITEREEEMRAKTEYERKLEAYKKRITPILHEPRDGYHHWETYPQKSNSRTHDARIQEPQNLRVNVPLVYNNEKIDQHAEDVPRIHEQRRKVEGHTNRAEYERELQENLERERKSTERPLNLRQGKRMYHPKSRAEIARLNALPIRARIIIKQESSNELPVIGTRNGGGNEVTYQGLNPLTNGLPVSNFPAPATEKAPIAAPPPCTQAIVACCRNGSRLSKCFDAKGCPGGNWDSNPCSQEKFAAAVKVIKNWYEN